MSIKRLYAPLLIAAALTLIPCATVWAGQKAPVKADKAVTKPAPQSEDVLKVPVDHGVTVSLKFPAASVFIANPDVADIQVTSPTTVVVFGKKTGQTTMIAASESGATTFNKRIVVEQDLTELRQALAVVLPNSKIDATSVPNGIILTGESKDPAAIEDARRLALRYIPKEGEIINRIKVTGSNQIQIRVRFAEVSREVDKRFGINWESLGKIGGMTFGLASGNPVLSSSSVTGFARTTTANSTNDVLGMSYSKGRWDINAAIDALAVDGFVTVLAEPSLTAMSGETASFLAGGEFPIPIPQGNNTISIMFKQYGVSLAFTPTIIGGDRINLHVKPEVSQLSTNGQVTIDSMEIPALTTRRAETTIELGSGQSFAIAGLLNHNQQQSLSKYPFLGDIPVLGTLFRSSRFQNDETELVIIITPYIVKPIDERQVSLPTDGISPPSDLAFITDGQPISHDPDTRPISGQPTAVRAEGEAPIPAAAPVGDVNKNTLPPTALAKESPSAGGYIVE